MEIGVYLARPEMEWINFTFWENETNIEKQIWLKSCGSKLWHKSRWSLRQVCFKIREFANSFHLQLIKRYLSFQKPIMLYFHHHRCGAAVCVWGGSCAIKIIKVLATAEFVLGIWWYWLDVMDVLHIYIYLQTAPLLSVRPSWKSRSLVHSKILTLIFPDFFVGFSKEHYRLHQEGPDISFGSVRLLCACWIPKVWTSQRALSPVS